MQNLRQIVEGRTIQAYGTSEGVVKSWDTRGRGRESRVDCDGPNCKDEVQLPSKGSPSPVVVPHLDNLEFMATSGKEGQHIHWDKEAIKTMLRMALVQLDSEDHSIRYVNSKDRAGTGHYAKLEFRQPGHLTSSAEE